MSYDFANLSPADFEDLVRELIGHELKVRFEAFGAGPDDGMDGRRAAGAKAKSALKKERASIDRIRPKPKRYVLATSRPLTPANKAVLAKIIGKVLNAAVPPRRGFHRRTGLIGGCFVGPTASTFARRDAWNGGLA
jgi:hypothetical protein